MSKATEKLGRRLRLGVIGGGPKSFIGVVHRSAATIHEEFDVVAGVFSSDPQRSMAAGKSLGVKRLMKMQMRCLRVRQIVRNLSMLLPL
ncbi:hypothetical protein [Veronia nyctiphanis]|uniref:hypothetical protein n=1 Tax=Veronia nyctiphanis TaxID=1278244 RepID=UPI001F2ACCBE|nr:hypothetical protein [Veronia nyctiphanis]